MLGKAYWTLIVWYYTHALLPFVWHWNLEFPLLSNPPPLFVLVVPSR